MKAHALASTGEAYDACQCGETLKDGDILDVEPEGIVGLAWTWPVAVTAEKGELHEVNPGAGALDRVAADAGWSQEQIVAAMTLAAERGYEIADEFKEIGWS